MGGRYTSNKETVEYGGHARCLPNVRTVTVKITTYNVEYLRLLKQNLTVSDKWDRQYAAAVVLRDVKFDARICRRAHLRVKINVKTLKFNK